MPRYLIAINPHDNYDPFVEIKATKREMQWPSCERFASSASRKGLSGTAAAK
jgi:hypothetical protein